MSGASTRRSALARRALERLQGALDDVLGDRLRHQPGQERDRTVRVSAHTLLERCPRRSANPADDYVDSTTTVRRRIGLLALRRSREMGAAGADLAANVAEVVRDREGWPTSLRFWFEGLEPPARAAVEAAALTWCADVLRLIGTAPKVRWSDPFMPPRWNVSGRAVQLSGSTDAALGTPRTGEKLLLVVDAVPGPGDRVRAGHAAVLRALGSGHAPERVSLGSPSMGTIRPVEVDESLVDLTVDRIAEVTGYLADPDAAPTAPGRWCRHCHLLDVCQSAVGGEPTT